VMVRLATAHRVTDDLDAVTWTEDGTPDAPIAVLLEHGATRSRNGVDLGDVHIDLIAVSDYEPDQLPVDVDDTMFVITHTYGLSSATWLTIEARRSDDVSVRATARVATPAALVAMKLRAMQQRRANALNKRASDAYDAYRLLASVRHQRQPDAPMACHRISRHGRGEHRRAPNGRLPLRRRPRRPPARLTIYEEVGATPSRPPGCEWICRREVLDSRTDELRTVARARARQRPPAPDV